MKLLPDRRAFEFRRFEIEKRFLFRKLNYLAKQQPKYISSRLEIGSRNLRRSPHLPRTSRPVPVRVREVVSGVGIVVIVVDVGGGEGVVVPEQVRMILFDAVVQDGDGHALAADALLPRLGHVHVQPVVPVQVPHVVPVGVIDWNRNVLSQSANVLKQCFIENRANYLIY